MSKISDCKTPAAERKNRWRPDAKPTLNARRYNALPAFDRCQCGNCLWRGSVENLLPPDLLYDRISEGEPMWAGDCPRCDAIVNSEHQLATWKREDEAKAAAPAPRSLLCTPSRPRSRR